MKLQVKRFEFGTDYTIGRLYIDGVYACYTLEDKVRDQKIYGETAIPTGTYKVVLDFSPRFQRTLPHLLNVPNFEGVRIHSGNFPKDTEGCILVGLSWPGNGSIGMSRMAMGVVMVHLQDAVARKEEITIEVV